MRSVDSLNDVKGYAYGQVFARFRSPMRIEFGLVAL